MIELKHRYSGALLYKSEKENVREAVIEAVENGAYLRGAYLEDAKFVTDAGVSLQGYQFIGYWRDGLRVKAGYRDFSIEDAKIHWAGASEELAKVNLIEAVAKARGWNSEAAESEGSQPAFAMLDYDEALENAR